MNTSNSPTENEYKDWESLKNGNPWNEVFKPNTDELLNKLLYGNNEKFVYSGDEDVIGRRNKELKAKRKGNNVFITTLLPKPCRGNLKDPKLVILSLNPGYKERVKKTLFTLLDPTYQKQFIKITKDNALLEARHIISPNNPVDDAMDNGYWSGKLSNLEYAGADLSKIGLIQFIPYASKHFDSWGDEASLESQKFTIKLIHYLLDKTDALFLVMRSIEQWEKLIGNEMHDENHKDRFLYNTNPRCQNITHNNLKDNYNRIIKALKA